MSAPAPPVPLAFQNSVIHTNTLFTFQPDAFQSIDLSPGAQWKQLPLGISVNGSQSIIGQSEGQDALFIVGGRSNASETSFPGLQKYVFSTGLWEELKPETSVAQNRVQHGAAYLQSTSSILLFGGSQDNSYRATSQTYTITTNEPYTMKSFPAGAPAVQNPILMPYNASHALLAGGGDNQDQIWTFSEANGWVMMTTTIPNGVGDASKVQGAVVSDASGNKQLELFDMSVSPNTVKTVPLSNQFHKRRASRVGSMLRRASNGPTATRTGFSLAQASDKVVLVGGTSDQSAGPMVVYDQTANNWASNEVVFGSSAGSNGAASPAASGAQPSSSVDVHVMKVPGASSGVVSASSGAIVPASFASSASSAASAGASSAASGSSSGSAAASATGSAASSAASAAASATDGNNDNAAASSAAAAAAASSSAAAAAAPSSGPDATTIIIAAVLGSFFGIAAILAFALLFVRYRRNKAKEAAMARDAALDEKRAASPASSIGSLGGKRSPFQDGRGPMISKPTLVPRSQAEDLNSPRRLTTDEGWSRYFTNNNTVENLYPGNAHNNPLEAAEAAAAAGAAAGAAIAAARNNNRDTQYTSQSEYTVDSVATASQNGHDSALIIPPLKPYGASHARGPSDGTIPEEDDATFLASSSGSEGWDPTAHSGGNAPAPRPASSIYYDRASSVYPASVVGMPTSHPPMPNNGRPTTAGKDSAAAYDDKGMRSIIHKDFGASPTSPQYEQQQGFTFPESPVRRIVPGAEPRSAGNATGRKQGADLSWLQFDQK